MTPNVPPPEAQVGPDVQQSRAELFGHYADDVCDPNEPQQSTPEEEVCTQPKSERALKMEEFAKETPEQKKARWAQNDGKLSPEAWAEIQKLEKGNEQKQAMLQAGIDKLDYDDPRRAQLEKVQHWMNEKDSVNPKSEAPDGERGNLLQLAGRTGKSGVGGEQQLKEGETRCGEVANQMLLFSQEKGAKGLPGGSYFYAKGTEGSKTSTPGAGDVVHLRNEAKPGKEADDNGHASMFMISSPDGTQWLTFDGGQGSANGDQQKIALSMRNVSTDAQGRQMVSGPDQASANPADNGSRAVSKTWDYQKLHDQYLNAP
jgi:hypothetical protein